MYFLFRFVSIFHVLFLVSFTFFLYTFEFSCVCMCVLGDLIQLQGVMDRPAYLCLPQATDRLGGGFGGFLGKGKGGDGRRRLVSPCCVVVLSPINTTYFCLVLGSLFHDSLLPCSIPGVIEMLAVRESSEDHRLVIYYLLHGGTEHFESK